MEFTEFEQQKIFSHCRLPHRYWRPAEAAYAIGTRYYHTWQHALSVLCWANNTLPRALEFSLGALYHDAVYDVRSGSPDNERLSAQLMVTKLSGFPEISDEVLSAASELIMLTSQHGKIESGDVSERQAIFLDCDMASFADPRWEVQLQTEFRIQGELLHKYTKAEIGLGRADFLRKLLYKKSLFLSDHFRSKYETQARENIWRLLQLPTRGLDDTPGSWPGGY